MNNPMPCKAIVIYGRKKTVLEFDDMDDAIEAAQDLSQDGYLVAVGKESEREQLMNWLAAA